MHTTRALNELVGQHRPYPSLRELARKSGLQPSSILRPLAGGVMGPSNTRRLLAVLTPQQRARYVSALVRDHVPEESHAEFAGKKTVYSTLSPLAQKTLTTLEKSAEGDRAAEAFLEHLGRMMGLEENPAARDV